MIDFPRSTFTWKSHPWQRDAYFRYPGGFVGTPGQVYHVRFNIEAACTVRADATGQVSEIFLSAPCRHEYTIASRNLFQVPSAEFRLAFSRQRRLTLAREPSDVVETTPVVLLADAFQHHWLHLRQHAGTRELTVARAIIEASLAHGLLNAVSTYHDPARGLTITLEYPVNLINLNVVDDEFQVCTGPVVLPDLATWDGQEVTRVFLAHASFSALDHIEFILQREIDAAPEARAWHDQPRGRDRLALHDPANQPPGYPPARPRPTVFHESWEYPAKTVVLLADI
jgi:hypothetical protein